MYTYIPLKSALKMLGKNPVIIKTEKIADLRSIQIF